MKHRILISEFLREWNYKYRNPGDQKRTQYSLAKELIEWHGYTISVPSMRNEIARMNIGSQRYINISLVASIAILLNCTLAELLDVADNNLANKVFKKYAGQKIKAEILYDLL